MDHVEYLFNPHGCEVTDVNLIRDNDVIIASAKPKFEKPGKKKVGETAIYTMLKEALKLILKFAVDMLRKQITEAVASAWYSKFEIISIGMFQKKVSLVDFCLQNIASLLGVRSA